MKIPPFCPIGAAIAVGLVAGLPGLIRYAAGITSSREAVLYAAVMLAYLALLGAFAALAAAPGRWMRGRSVAFSVVLPLALVGAGDAVLGRVVPQDPAHQGFVFPPRQVVRYETPEFDFTASINNLGFRDRDFAVEKSCYRILAIGDSSTYGWGVSLEQAWSKVLEGTLRERGHAVEIANLGKPGTGPLQYAALAEKAVPILKPNLVVIAMLQGDDLAQSGQNDVPQTPFQRLLSRPLDLIYPHVMDLITRTTIMRLQVSPRVWQKEAREVVGSLNAEQRLRYQRMDPKVRASFDRGEVNPGLLVLCLKFPNYFTQTFDLDNPYTQSLAQHMGNCLQRVRRVADVNGARVLVVTVPYGPYTSPQDLSAWQRLGLDVDPGMATTQSMDQAVSQASTSAGVPFVTVMPDFRKQAAQRRLFFELDRHQNALGNHTFAELLVPVIEPLLK